MLDMTHRSIACRNNRPDALRRDHPRRRAPYPLSTEVDM